MRRNRGANWRRYEWARLWVLAILAVLPACSASRQIKPTQPLATERLALSGTHTLGQTFTAHYAGLEGVLIYLEPSTAGSGRIILRLFDNSSRTTHPTRPIPVRTASRPIQDIRSAGFYRFQFEPIGGGAHHDYGLTLRVQGEGEVLVGAAAGEAYIGGALYADGRPQDAQMAFQLDHAAKKLGFGLILEMLGWLVYLAAAVAGFILPGWALLNAWLPGWERLTWAEKLGLAGGVGMAIYPILLLWGELAGVRLGRGWALAPAAVGAVWLAWRVGRKWFGRREGGRGNDRPEATRRFGAAGLRSQLETWVRGGDLLLVAVLALVGLTRFWAIREVDLPLWHDSYQHAVMTQLILDNGGLFSSWEPYSPYVSLSVHFGFHAQAAVIGWLLGIDGAKATLIFGQLANLLALTGLLGLALRLSNGSRWAGAGTLMAAGLFSLMPAYYVNWGRFPQLAGQAMLPVTAWLVWEALSGWGKDSSPQPNETVPAGSWRISPGRLRQAAGLVLAGLTLAGMLLTYYRTVYAFVTFMTAVWAIGWGIAHFGLDWRCWLKAAGRGMIMAAVGLALLAPWLLRTQDSRLGEVVEAGTAQAAASSYVMADLQSWRLLNDYVPRPLLWIAGAAVVWGLVRRRFEIPGMALWVGLWVGYFMGQLIRLPGANLISNFSILIALYIPAGLACGWLLSEIITPWAERSRPVAVLATLALAGLALTGANDIRSVTTPAISTLVTRPDMRAMDWIQTEVSDEARFLVQAYTIYGGTTAVGSDAGWWIPLLAGRENSMPPQYALMNEVPEPLTYTQDVITLTHGLELTSPSSAEGLKLLCANRITHIYLGQQGGRIGFEARPLFEAADFLDRAAFKPVYHRDRVYIFELTPYACRSEAP